MFFETGLGNDMTYTLSTLIFPHAKRLINAVYCTSDLTSSVFLRTDRRVMTLPWFHFHTLSPDALFTLVLVSECERHNAACDLHPLPHFVS